MGKRGPTATCGRRGFRHFAYSRWGNAGQPQRHREALLQRGLIADGETRANRNHTNQGCDDVFLIADGETRANRNHAVVEAGLTWLIADGETRANRNVSTGRRCGWVLIADGETRANRNSHARRW